MDAKWVSDKAPAARRVEAVDFDAAMAPFAAAGVDRESRWWYLLSRIVKRHTSRAGVSATVHATVAFLRWMRDQGNSFTELTEDDAEDFANYRRRQGFHPSTVYQRVCAARTLYEEALRKDSSRAIHSGSSRSRRSRRSPRRRPSPRKTSS